MSTLRLLLLWIPCLLTGLTPAAGQQAHSHHYTMEDGLPSTTLYEVIQDAQGYIWLSTDNGVSRFDGRRFENFGMAEGVADN
ncbi:MAG: hypothetical protein H6585_02915 [Flavobacteriales bacterium]|nr:hypothetical protein [Flavobacteriales bacterium]MCB9447278.1 hypothetical protein [Flavobacteriales bacterium]